VHAHAAAASRFTASIDVQVGESLLETHPDQNLFAVCQLLHERPIHAHDNPDDPCPFCDPRNPVQRARFAIIETL
jgi:hypothetical protein